MNRRIVLIIFAALFAAAGAGLVFLYAVTLQSRAAKQYDATAVVRAVAPIAQGTTAEVAIDAGAIVVEQIAKGAVVEGAYTSLDDLEETYAQVPLGIGEQITPSKFATKIPSSTIDLQIPPNLIAISIDLTDTGRVAGFVRPGDEVAVFFDNRSEVRLLLKKAKVVGVGSTSITTTTTTTQDDGTETVDEVPKTTMTLALNQRDSERVMYAASNGELNLALINEKSKVRPSGGVNSSNVFKGN